MFQCEEQKVDIYQVLSFCLAFLKRKILLLLKIFFNEQNQLSKPQLLTQLANQQLSAQSYIDLLKTTTLQIVEKDEEILFHRFVYRIKQLIRNYFPIASKFQQLPVYLKKIETYSFKQNYKFEDFILYILERSPTQLERSLSLKMQEIKNSHTYKPCNPIKFIHSNHKYNVNNSFSNNDIQSNNMIYDQNSFIQQSLLQSLSNQQTNRDQRQLRPIDIFNNSIAAIQNCLDCDITFVRGIYFNLQKERENSVPNLHTSSNAQTTLSTNKTIQQVQEQMLNSNQSIKDSIKSFDRQYSRYQTRILRYQAKVKKQHKRCQTAKPARKQFTYGLNHQSKKQATIISENKKKIDTNTISNISSTDEKKEMYKEIQHKRQSILKMKSISVSAHKGHLQLCSQKKQHCKKMSLTFANFKYGTQNSRKNTGNNLKKKYQTFMNTCFQNTIKNNQIQDNQSSYQPALRNENSKKNSFEDWNFRTIDMSGGIKSSKGSQSRQYQIVSIKGVEALIFKDKKASKCQSSFSSQNQDQMTPKHQVVTMQVAKKREVSSPQTFNDLESTIKSFMKGINVNHRNYNNTQYRSKRLFDTLNPELYIKTIRKS